MSETPSEIIQWVRAYLEQDEDNFVHWEKSLPQTPRFSAWVHSLTPLRRPGITKGSGA